MGLIVFSTALCLCLMLQGAFSLTSYTNNFPQTVDAAIADGWTVSATCYANHGRYALHTSAGPLERDKIALFYDQNGDLIGQVLASCIPHPEPYEIRVPPAGQVGIPEVFFPHWVIFTWFRHPSTACPDGSPDYNTIPATPTAATNFEGCPPPTRDVALGDSYNGEYDQLMPKQALPRKSQVLNKPRQKRQGFNVVGTLQVDGIYFLEDASLVLPWSTADIRDDRWLYTRTCVPSMGVHAQRIFGFFPYATVYDPFNLDQGPIGVEFISFGPQVTFDNGGLWEFNPGFNEVPRPHWSLHFYFDQAPIGLCTNFNEPDSQYRPYSGVGNNIANPTWGALFSNYKFEPGLSADYPVPDGSIIAGVDRPNARLISNVLFDAREGTISLRRVNSLHTYWGMLITSDITSMGQNPTNTMAVPVPQCDIYKDPYCTGTEVLTVNRAITNYNPATAGDPTVPATHPNEVTHWLDASWLYGNSPVDNALLRTFEHGMLIDTYTDLVDFPLVSPSACRWRVSGDRRTNKTPPMGVLHQIMVREHNRLAHLYHERFPDWDDERLFQQARMLTIAQYQKISSREYLAALIGEPVLPYRGYNSSVDPTILYSFGAAAYRFGHAEIRTVFPRQDVDGFTIREGDLLVRDTHYTPFPDDAPIEGLLRGLNGQLQATVNDGFVDDVRNYMWGPITGGSDLAVLNIMRGRDLGLPSYNDMREYYGLGRARHFTDISSNKDVQERLRQVYDRVDDVDLYVGGLAEDPHNLVSNLGPLFRAIIFDQFNRLRDGDRYWYENILDNDTLASIYHSNIETIIQRNTNITDDIGVGAFFVRTRQLFTFVADGFGAFVGGEAAHGDNGNAQGLVAFNEEEEHEEDEDGALGGGHHHTDEHATHSNGTFSNTTDYEFFVDLSPIYRLSWNAHHTRSHVDIQLQVRATGWVGIGFDADPGTMENADIYLCRIIDGVVEVRDSYALDVGPPRLDSTIGGKSSVFDVSGEEVDGVTTVRFSRPLAATDFRDKEIPVDDFVKVIFAFNPDTDELFYHGPTRSAERLIRFVPPVTIPPTPYDHVDTSDAIIIVLGILTGLCALFVFCLFISTLVRPKWYHYQSVLFCQIIMVGILISYIADALLLSHPEDAICTTIPWLIGIAYVLVFSALFVKTWRIMRLMSTQSLKAVTLTNKRILPFVGVVLLLEFAYLTAWTIVDPNEQVTVSDSAEEEDYHFCRTDSVVWWGVFLGWKLLFLIIGVYLAFRIRKFPSQFNESKSIGFAIYNTTVVLVIAIALGFFLEDNVDALVVVSVGAMLLIFTFVPVVMFVPRVYAILKGADPMALDTGFSSWSDQKTGGSSMHSMGSQA